MEDRSADASVEADDRQIPADDQVQLGGHTVDDHGDLVAAGQHRVRPGRGNERADLGPRTGVGPDAEQAGAVAGDAAGGQPGPESGLAGVIPVGTGCVADEAGPDIAPVPPSVSSAFVLGYPDRRA
jgi:hypothetical protein